MTNEEMTMALEGRVAIVTGSGGGLGRSHVRYLASKGARVVVNDLSQESADNVANEITAAATNTSQPNPIEMRKPVMMEYLDGSDLRA